MPWIDENQEDDIYFEPFRYTDPTNPTDDWGEDEFIYFYRAKGPEIDKKQAALLAKYGKDEPGMWSYTLILALGQRWTRRLPANFLTRTKQGAKAPHPYAGKVPPFTMEYLQKLSDAEIGAALSVAMGIIIPRTEEAQQRFRDLADRLSGSSATLGSAARRLSDDPAVSEADPSDTVDEGGD